MKWKGEKVSGKNIFKKSSSSLTLHAQGRRSCTVPFKTAPCRFFFFEEKKKNLGVTQKWVMTRFDVSAVAIRGIVSFLTTDLALRRTFILLLATVSSL
jgi:hypothetical protein